MYPLVSELAADGIPVTVSCRVLGSLASPTTDGSISRSPTANSTRPTSPTRCSTPIGTTRSSATGSSPMRSASPRITQRCRTGSCGASAATTAGGHGSANPRARKGSKPGTPAHDDLVRRDFTATAPNQLWLTDLTEHRTREGKLYLCAIKDVFSNRIVGWSIDSRMKARLVVAAIEMAVARRDGDVAGCVLHSDRGSQFRARKVHRTLTRHQMVGSMGQVGAAGDNAAMESFFALLQRNVLDRQSWATRNELRIEIVTWIERTYHRRRRQTRLGRLTPIDYEMIMTPQPATAA